MIESRLYYSANFADVICVYCSVDLPPGESDQEYLRQCEECKEKPKNNCQEIQEIASVCCIVCVLSNLCAAYSVCVYCLSSVCVACIANVCSCLWFVCIHDT